MQERGHSRAKAFGIELKLWRVRAGMLQSELAELVSVHATSVSQWERGDRADVPSLDTVEALDQALGAQGSLLRAAGYGQSVPAPPTDIRPNNPLMSLPLPGSLTPNDVAALMAIVGQLADARQTASANTM